LCWQALENNNKFSHLELIVFVTHKISHMTTAQPQL